MFCPNCASTLPDSSGTAFKGKCPYCFHLSTIDVKTPLTLVQIVQFAKVERPIEVIRRVREQLPNNCGGLRTAKDIVDAITAGIKRDLPQQCDYDKCGCHDIAGNLIPTRPNEKF